MNICFVLPELPRRPVGGYLIVFQYANRLAERKHNVSILFANKDTFKSKIKLETLRKLVIRFCMPFLPRWFKLNSRIKKYSFFQRNTLNKLENLDVCFATGIATVADVKSFFLKKCKCFYLIQDFENWAYNDSYSIQILKEDRRFLEYIPELCEMKISVVKNKDIPVLTTASSTRQTPGRKP